VELELVLNVDFGGFSFDTEMALWLSENREWIVIKESKYDYKLKDKYSINTLVEMSGNYFYSPHGDKIELRSNRDLIDCVRALQKLHENDSFPDSHYGHIHNFAIKKVTVHVEIENYYDGKERIKCWTSEEDED
jgi:hypothetical protein